LGDPNGRAIGDRRTAKTLYRMPMERSLPPGERQLDHSWIDEMSDADCMAVFWLYVDPPEPFLAAYPPPLLGAAMRYALRTIAESQRETA
jgi:hypothetical protein